jgi:hypothetical protein
MNTTTHNQHARPAASQTPRWSKDDIRAARMVAIAPLLEKRGMHLIESGGGNYIVRERPGLIIKDSYWRLPERNTGGNAIDLLTQIMRLGFNDAMLELSQTHDAQRRGAEPKPP